MLRAECDAGQRRMVAAVRGPRGRAPRRWVRGRDLTGGPCGARARRGHGRAHGAQDRSDTLRLPDRCSSSGWRSCRRRPALVPLELRRRLPRPLWGSRRRVPRGRGAVRRADGSARACSSRTAAFPGPRSSRSRPIGSKRDCRAHAHRRAAGRRRARVVRGRRRSRALLASLLAERLPKRFAQQWCRARALDLPMRELGDVRSRTRRAS